MFAIGLIAALTGEARAHDPMASWATLQVRPGRVTLEAELAVEAAMSVAGVPMGSAAAPPNAAKLLAQIDAASRAGQLYRFTGLPDGTSWVPTEVQVERCEDDGVGITATYPDAGDASRLRVEARFLAEMPAAHRSAFTILDPAGEVVASMILRPGKNVAELALSDTRAVQRPTSVPAAATSSAGKASVAPAEPGGLFSTYFKLGVEHILTGYDHLLFLLALLVGCRAVRPLIAIVTCFTIGHTVTLGLAASGHVMVPSRVIEPLIAASIVYVGLENLLRRDEPKLRWLLTLGFGLVHGFGFAGVLREIGFGAAGASVAVPLLAFNLGVESGQLAVIVIAVPLLVWSRRHPRVAQYEVAAVSLCVVVLGSFWLFQRLTTS